jgi:hypothetical protein
LLINIFSPHGSLFYRYQDGLLQQKVVLIDDVVVTDGL